MRRLLSAAAAVSVREYLIVRIFYVCGLRPGELFALRLDDVEPGLLRIDEALKETEKGSERIGETKTWGSNAYVSISPELHKEIETWLKLRNMADPYHRGKKPASNDLLFPSEAGSPFRIGNYLKPTLKPIATAAGISDMTYRSLRRTFAHHFQRYGSPKDAQAQLRHSTLEMTGWYMREIPDRVRSAVEKMDTEIMAKRPKNVDPKRTEYSEDRSLLGWTCCLTWFWVITFIDSKRFMVRPSGFEPPTFCSGGKRSIQLSYGRRPDILIVVLGCEAVKRRTTICPFLECVTPDCLASSHA
jgi:hypothetical protein